MNEDKMDLLLAELQDQKKYVKRQTRLLQVCTLILIVLIAGFAFAAGYLVPRLTGILEQTEQIVSELDTVAGELEDADISGMLQNVNDLVVDSQDTMEEALNKIQAIDIDTLNEAIDGLNKVVSPLAKLFGK